MPRVHQTLLIPNEQLLEAEAVLAGTSLPDIRSQENATLMVAVVRFNNNFSIAVSIVEGSPRHVVATLFDQHGAACASEDAGQIIDQDYTLMHDDTVYEATIVRAANTTLTAANVAAYNADPNRCPACGTIEIAAGPMQVDGKQAYSEVLCCACGAGWRDHYTFSGISTSPEHWTGPHANVARQSQ